MNNKQLDKVKDMCDQYTNYSMEWTGYDTYDDSDISYFADVAKRRDALFEICDSYKSDKKRLQSRKRDTFAVTLSIETLLDLICGKYSEEDKPQEDD